MGSQFSPQIGGHFGGQLSNWRIWRTHIFPTASKKGLVGSQFKPQNGGHFGGQKAKWRIWWTQWLNGGHPPDLRTFDTYGGSPKFVFH